MSTVEDAKFWLWIVVQDPGANEVILGQHFDKEQISFIPAFLDKETAQQCYGRLALKPGRTYEIQGIHIDELKQHATQNDFLIFKLDSAGKILETIPPDAPLPA